VRLRFAGFCCFNAFTDGTDGADFLAEKCASGRRGSYLGDMMRWNNDYQSVGSVVECFTSERRVGKLERYSICNYNRAQTKYSSCAQVCERLSVVNKAILIFVLEDTSILANITTRSDL
jgi:hypothetical protein